MEETYKDNASSDTNLDYDSFGSANSTMEETYSDGAQIEINHDYYRFAYDLVATVLDVRGELNHCVTHNLPEPPNYLFTKQHSNIVKTLLQKDTNHLAQKIHKFVSGGYDYNNYIICRDFFVREWKNRAYTEKSFISACASIAYVAAHFIRVNYYCGALDDVVVYIANWIEDILERGNIENSCW